METSQELLLQSSQLTSELKNIANKVFKGERISFDEGVYLYEHANLSYLGTLANYVREKKTKIMCFLIGTFMLNLPISVFIPVRFVPILA